MLNSIIDFSIKNKIVVIGLLIFLIVYGIYQVTLLPIDAVPDITNNQVQIITQVPSYGAEDIERLVTFPIEQSCSNVSGVTEMRSFSRFGLSLVTIVFKDDVDIYLARQMIAEKLQEISGQIPKDIEKPELGPITTGLGEIYQYVIRPAKGFEKKYSGSQLRTIQDWIVKRQLTGLEGVAEVSSFGGKLKQLDILVDPHKLNALDISISDVFKAVEINNENTGGGYIEKGPKALFIRTEGLVKNLTEIENIVVKKLPEGGSIRIKDVGYVKEGFATRYGAICYNDQGEVAGGIIMMLKGANSSKVIEDVKEKMEEIKRTLPEGIIVEPFLDRTKMVNNAISTVQTNLLEGALIVILILVLFLGNLRAGIIVASVIPLSMLFAVIMMNIFGVSGNLMSLGALDFGLIVDGAVIIVEAVLHYIHKRTNENLSIDQTVSGASKKMMNAAVFGQIIILIVYLPIFTLQGIEGKMFKPMAQTVTFALIGAFILSLTYVPVISSLLLSDKNSGEFAISKKLLSRIEYFYKRMLVFSLRHITAMTTSVVVLFIVSVILLSSMGSEFIPELEEGDFAVDTRVLTGSNLSTTIEFTQKAAGILKNRFPEVEKIVTKIGSGEVPTDPMPMEASDMMVILKSKSEWVSAKTFPELEEKMSEALKEIPGITAGFQFPVQMRFNELMTGARQDVVCKIYGENLDSLSKYAAELGKLVSSIDGVRDVYIEPISGNSQLIIDYKRDKLAQYGLNISDVNSVVNMALAGKKAGTIYEGEKKFSINVKFREIDKSDVQTIQNLLIPISSTLHIPLYQLATVELKNGVNQIQRESARRRIIVGFNIDGKDVQSVVDELKQKNNIRFSEGYSITYGGSFENLEKAKLRLLIAVPISLLLIFGLLYLAFKSVKLSILVYTAIPMSAIGGILFLFFREMPFSISAGIGFIALFGVSVLNGIVLISEFNKLKQDKNLSTLRIVLSGTHVRLRPVLMTALVASLGFIPMAFSNGSGAEVQRPLATVVIGGLVMATFLTLFVLPALYIISENGIKIKIPKKKFSFSILILLPLFFFGQKPVSLQEYLQLVKSQNTTINKAALRTESALNMSKNSSSFNPTSFTTEVGQINSAYIDNKFSVSQEFDFPLTYIRQKKLNESMYSKTKNEELIAGLEIESQAEFYFYYYLILKEKDQKINNWSSFFDRFLKRFELMLDKGDISKMEFLLIKNKYQKLLIEQNNNRINIDDCLNKLKLLAKSTEEIIPVEEKKLIAEINATEINLSNHPFSKVAECNLLAGKQFIRLEQAKLGPAILLNWNNGTFKGTGADNKEYTLQNRFNSVQLGLKIQLLPFYQSAKIKSLKTDLKIAELEKQEIDRELNFRKTLWLNQYKLQNNQFRIWENEVLVNAVELQKIAELQLSSGEINIMEFIIQYETIVTEQLNYYDFLTEYNKTIININSLNYGK